MAWKLWNRRSAESTRERIVDLLRRDSRTVDALATELGLTDNAVRSHLLALERDGLVHQEGVRRGSGAGKPATLYALDPAAEPLFSQAYTPLLLQLLGVLGERMTSGELAAMMRDVGARLAAVVPRPAGDHRQRVGAAAALLDELGGITEVAEEGGAIEIRSRGCPLAAAVAERPEVCRAVEALVTEVVGVPVRERCDRSGRPRCRFEVSAGPAEPGRRRRSAR